MGNFSIHKGFVLAGVLEDKCVYISLDDLQKGLIPLTSLTIGDETIFVVDQKSTPTDHIRQIQTQLPTRPPPQQPTCQTNLMTWNNTNDLMGSSVDFLQEDATLLELTTANIVDESPECTGLYASTQYTLNYFNISTTAT